MLDYNICTPNALISPLFYKTATKKWEISTNQTSDRLASEEWWSDKMALLSC